MHVIITVHTLGPQSSKYAKQKLLSFDMILQCAAHAVQISVNKHIHK